MNSDLLTLALLVFSLLGQFEDAHTTDVGLTDGLVEANPIGRWLIGKIGMTASYPVKCFGVGILLPLLPMFVSPTSHLGTDLIASFTGTLGFVATFLNARLLKKSGKVSSIVSALF